MYMDYPVQFMISGPDPAVLKRLCGEVEALMNEDSTTMLVTNDWGPMTPVLNVNYHQPIARVANLSREDVGLALLATTDGLPVGSYYEGEHDLPIYIKSMGEDGLRPGRLNNVPVWSLVPSTNVLNLETVKELMMGMISTDEVMTAVAGSTPLNQATNGIAASWEVPVVRRYSGRYRHNVITRPAIRQTTCGTVCCPRSKN